MNNTFSGSTSNGVSNDDSDHANGHTVAALSVVIVFESLLILGAIAWFFLRRKRSRTQRQDVVKDPIVISSWMPSSQNHYKQAGEENAPPWVVLSCQQFLLS